MTGQQAHEAEQASSALHYDVVALQMTIYYNRDGDHDHDGLLFALRANLPILRHLQALTNDENPEALFPAARARAQEIGVDLPVTPAQARQPHPLVRPLVLRARQDDLVTVTSATRSRAATSASIWSPTATTSNRTTAPRSATTRRAWSPSRRSEPTPGPATTRASSPSTTPATTPAARTAPTSTGCSEPWWWSRPAAPGVTR